MSHEYCTHPPAAQLVTTAEMWTFHPIAVMCEFFADLPLRDPAR